MESENAVKPLRFSRSVLLFMIPALFALVAQYILWPYLVMRIPRGGKRIDAPTAGGAFPAINRHEATAPTVAETIPHLSPPQSLPR